MAVLWGGPDITKLSATPISAPLPPSPVFPGFDKFLIERFHPICWDVLRNPQFPLHDAQGKQVLTEIAGLEQTIYLKTGNEFIEHLQMGFFPSLGINGTEFIRSMTTSPDKRAFVSYLQAFLKQQRG
jgi:exportin-T